MSVSDPYVKVSCDKAGCWTEEEFREDVSDRELQKAGWHRVGDIDYCEGCWDEMEEERIEMEDKRLEREENEEETQGE